MADYWRAVREFYAPFETPSLPASSDLYRHEMPGGQYTNLFQQAQALGLADRWSDVCQVYADVNQLLGDIVKVTPTSKAVGDLALFLISNDMSADDVLSSDREISYPQSVLDLLSGRMGQVDGGFPKDVQKRILKDEEPLTKRAGETMDDADFEAAKEKIKPWLEHDPSQREALSYILYPQVYEEFTRHQRDYIDTSVLSTPSFFYGLEPGEEIAVEIEKGKTLIIRFLAVGEPHDGERTVFFEMNGQPRDVTVTDQSLESSSVTRRKAESGNANHVAATMPGMVVSVVVAAGDDVVKGQKLLTLEAMKMQTVISAETDGKVAEVLVDRGDQIENGDLLIVLE